MADFIKDAPQKREGPGMTALLRADFLRVRRDIILPIALIALAAFALITPLFYLLLNAMPAEDLAQLESMGISPSASGRSVFLSSLSLSNNFGMILPIFIAILVCRDFSSGTVRNKIIAGHKRIPIYTSHLVTALTLMVALFLLYALLTLAVGSLIYGYGAAFDAGEIIFLLKALLMGSLIFATSASLAVFFAAVTRNVGLTIVLQVAVSLVSSLPAVIVMMLPSPPELLRNIGMIIPSYQINLAMQGRIDGRLLAFTGVTSVLYFALITLAGLLIYRKSEQK